MSTNFLEDVQKSVDEIKEIKQQLIDKLKPRFKEIFESFLEENPQVESLFWTQYTPYFNDGEPCEFSVGELYGMFGMDDECTYEGSLPIYDFYLNDYLKEDGAPYRKESIQKIIDHTGLTFDQVKELNDKFSQLQSAFSALPEDIMQDIFGDHARIVVTKDGIDCEEYDHD